MGTKTFKIIFLFLAINCVNIPNISASQEVGDVVYRYLEGYIMHDMHGAIYKGYFRRGDAAGEDSSHDAIEMTGVTNKKFCSWPNLLCVEEWSGINVLTLDKFKKSSPPYYGAFSSKNENFDKKVRGQIIEEAENLMRRADKIEYIVTEGQSLLSLSTSYFLYEDLNRDGKISDNEITRMRSDAFVEYCYASVENPIMQYDIKTTSGADALIALAAAKNLYPSDQNTRLGISVVDIPEIEVVEPETSKILTQGEIVSKDLLNIKVTDSKSGPAKLEIYSPRFYQSPNDSIIFRPFYSAQGEVNKETSYDFTANVGKLPPGPIKLLAYDFAGNPTSEFIFTIGDYPNLIYTKSEIPLYENFKGVSVSTPSTLERDHEFSFSDNIAGISSVTISGGQGDVMSWSFDPPIQSTVAYLSGMDLGEYSIKITNSVGKQTVAPFKISTMTSAILPEYSTQTYVYDNLLTLGTFYNVINLNFTSEDDLKTVQFINRTSDRVVESKDVSGKTASVNFNVSFPATDDHPLDGIPSGEDSNHFTYSVRSFDVKGNVQTVDFGINSGWCDLLFRNRDFYTNPILSSIDHKDAVHDTSYCVPGFHNSYGMIAYNYEVNKTSNVIETTEMLYPYNAYSSTWSTSEPLPEFSTTNPHIMLGAGELKINTWDLADKSDMASYTVESANLVLKLELVDGNTNYLTTIEPTYKHPMLQPMKRYAQMEMIYNLSNLIHIPECRWNEDEETYICRYRIPTILPGRLYLTGSQFTIWQASVDQNVFIGNDIKIPLKSGVEIGFDEVTSTGLVTAVLTNRPAPNGYSALPENTVYTISADSHLSFSGPANLSFSYSTATITPAQENRLKLLKIIDPATGKYEELSAELDTVNKKISADVSSFSDFVVAVPEYSNPQESESSNMINGKPELGFLAGVAINQSVYDLNSEGGLAALSSLKSANKLPATNVYALSAATTTLDPSGAVTMRYYDAAVAALGGDENTLAIYGFSQAGELYKLPYLTLDKDNNVLTARSPTLYPLYAVLVSSVQAENVPPSIYPDGISPETDVVYSGVQYSTDGPVYVSTTTGISFTASDPQVPDVITSGIQLTNFMLDPSETNVDISTYTEPFAVAEGTHTLYYLSLDNAGNYEFPKEAAVYADGTAPETTASALGSPIANAATGYITVVDSVTLAGSDPEVGGVASGLKSTFMLIDATPDQCVSTPTFTGLSGTCDNPLYSAPFALPTGQHILYYLSIDNVDNEENFKTAYFVVTSTIDAAPPVTSLEVLGSILANGATGYIQDTDFVTINSTDPYVEGYYTSGIDKIYYLIDHSPEECVSPPTFTGPGGTCENPLYASPFTLSTGTHFIYYAAGDKAGNAEEPFKTAWVVVTSTTDATPPVTSLEVLGEVLPNGATGYISTGDFITITSTDPYVEGADTSGVGDVFYLVDHTPEECEGAEENPTALSGTCENPLYAGPFTLSTGTHFVYYSSDDNAGNEDIIRTAYFSVGEPVQGMTVSDITPSSGPIGTPFTINGSSFGTYLGANTKVLFGDTTAPLTLWTDTQIKGTVPGTISVGTYSVVVERVEGSTVTRSNLLSFELTAPYITGFTPTTGPIGTPFTITGESFGNYTGATTKVLVNGSTSYLTLWTDTKIQGKLPYFLTGEYPVIVQRDLNGGLSESNTVYISVVEPQISTITPSSGKTGISFTIDGAGFGTYEGANTKLWVGTMPASLTLWIDSQIKGVIPALNNGAYVVKAERVSWTGQSAYSNTLEFTVTEGIGTLGLNRGIPLTVEFKLGEVFVYPNPAKNGKVPTFHIETGFADRVKIKIYNVAGEPVKEQVLTGNPNKTSPVYAYEWGWQGYIPSGVYYYTIETEKAGKKLKTKGKFAVVR